MKYFAYGSNMDKSQMKRRCSDSKFLGKAMIEGYWLDFTRESSNWDGGVADIVKDPDNFVWGILYDISDKDLESLDYYEACPVYYSVLSEYFSKRESLQINIVISNFKFLLGVWGLPQA